VLQKTISSSGFFSDCSGYWRRLINSDDRDLIERERSPFIIEKRFSHGVFILKFSEEIAKRKRKEKKK
jgi:hypothetical protein